MVLIFYLKQTCYTFISQVQANLGYCPQFDALHDQLTGRETLNMYARLRGVPSDSMDTVVSSLIDALLLRPHADKLTSAYRFAAYLRDCTFDWIFSLLF